MDVCIDCSKEVIETKRLILRGWKEEDIKDMFEYASVKGVGEMAGWKHHETIEETHKIISDFISEKNVFAIVCKENEKVIGSLGLHHSRLNDNEIYKNMKIKEIGYVLSKDYWGKGLMPEAVKAVIAFCFEKHSLEALTIQHGSTNSQSEKVIKKCGFTLMEKGRNFSQFLQTYGDEMKYILLRDQ
ncbi:GNAT family N-acetyltransferase [Clostridium sp. E02]|uniref:GNAT family N-acetyltransferase n=1 Tax=Clostridium sp. E02 TaxID=2487134 RepID=UPI000F54AD94|nr:GNAT family N-acetyltransferase [Clostridium sp. E02]